MTKMSEHDYITGNRVAWTIMLQECLTHLGYNSTEANRTNWIIEREATIAQLRELCQNFGDNNWDETLNLADVIRKHLAPYLKEP